MNVIVPVIALGGLCVYTFIAAALSQVLPLLGPGKDAKHRRECPTPDKCHCCSDNLEGSLMGAFWPAMVVLWLPIIAGLWLGDRFARAKKAAAKTEVPQARVTKY